MAKKSSRTKPSAKKKTPAKKSSKWPRASKRNRPLPFAETNHSPIKPAPFETLAENAPDVIFRVDRNLRFIFINRRVTELTGIPKEDFGGKTLLELGLPRHLSRFLGSQAQEVFDSHLTKEMEFNFTGPDGLRWFHSRMVPECDVYGNVETVLGIAHDITDLKRAEFAYREENALRKSMEESLLVGIMAVDLEGRQSYVNPSFCKMVGWSKEELLGAKPPFVYWPPDEMQKITQTFEQMLTGNHPKGSLELCFQRKNGERFDALLLFSKLADSNGTPLGWIGSVGDITEQRRKEEEIRRLNRDLEQRVIERTQQLGAANDELRRQALQLEALNKELEAFTSSVSHDLKAPLIAASGFCRRLLDHCGDQLDARGSHYLQQIKEACQRMNQLVEDLLRLSRVRTSQLKFEHMDMSELAWSAATQLKEAQPEREAIFFIQEGLTAKGDPQLIRIALDNLFSNAWKYTTKRKQTRIEFGLTKTVAGEPAFWVRDNGCGFELSKADKIFLPFQRLHTDEEFFGSGVGLATVHRVVTRHGGRIWAESAKGEGATFFFTLPS